MKTRRRQSSRSRSASRRWHIPPPLIHGSEPLEGGQILQEWDGGIGIVLWQSFRDCLLWATSEPSRRPEAFAAAARGADTLESLLDGVSDETARKSLRRLAEIVRTPGKVREDDSSRACRRISEWAADQGKFQTALAFAQAAALSAPRDANAAFWVATMAVRATDAARAEIWFRRAIGLARRAKDWRMYSRAFGGLGKLYMWRGNMPAADRLFHRALRGARRGGMRREQAEALHDLFSVAIEISTSAEAETLARRALEAYGFRSNRVPILANDVAFYWMEQGQFNRAFPVFQAVLPHIRKPTERLAVLSNIVRAAGGIGNEAVARNTADEITRVLSDSDFHVYAARIFVDVARGFVSLGDRTRAEAAANRAVFFAERYRESKVRFEAEAILDSLRNSRTHPLTAEPIMPKTSAPDPLVADFLDVLETAAGAAH